MKRIVLFLLTNIAVMVVLSVILHLTGLDRALGQPGAGIDVTGLLLASAVIGMTGSFISLAMSKQMAKWSTGAQVISTPESSEERWLVETVRAQAERAGIGMPEVAMFDSPTPNAFATGMSRNNALVAVSTGLLQRMSRDEVEAVLGHEVSHVANGDMVTLALIQGVVNTFVFFLSRVVGTIVDRAVFKTERGVGPGYYVTMIVAEIVLGILATLIVLWFSRRREFAADAGGATLAGRNKMIAALERLRQSHDEPALPQQLAAFGISGGPSRLMRLFMSHPPLEERIEALRAGAGRS